MTSLCAYHSVITAMLPLFQSGSHDVTWLSKPTVLVSVLHKKAFCLVTHPHVLNWTHSCDVWHSFAIPTICVCSVEACHERVILTDSQVHDVSASGCVCVFRVCACSVDCKWHDSARWMYIIYLYVCVSVIKLFDMEAELVKCLSNGIWNLIISRVKAGGRPHLTMKSSHSYFHNFSFTAVHHVSIEARLSESARFITLRL